MSETDGLQLPVGVTEKAFMQQIARMENKLAKMEGQQISKFKKANSGSARTFKELDATAVKTFSNISTQASAASKAFIMGFAGGAVTTAMASFTTGLSSTVKGIAAIGDEAKRAGLSVVAFQEWKFVAEQNRIGLDALVDGFKELSLRADEFVVTGKGSAEEAFTRLGYSATELKTKLKDPSALMLEIIGRLEDMDKAAQIRIADELFGGTGGEQFVQLLEQGEAGIRKTLIAADEAGAVIEENLIKKADELDKRWQYVTATIDRGFKRAAVGVADFVAEISGLQASLDDLLGDEGRARAVLGNEAYEGLKASQQAVNENVEAIEGLDDAIADLQWSASQLAVGLAYAAQEAGNIGNDTVGAELIALANAMNDVISQFDSGEMNAEEFATSLISIRDEANATFEALSEADNVGMEAAISEVGRLEAAMMAAAGMARSLAGWVANIVGVDLSVPENTNTGTPLSSGDTGLMPPLPVTTGTPLSGSGKSLLPPANKSSGGSGRAGGGKRSREEYKEAIADLQEEIALLNAESAALLQAAGSGQHYAEALEIAAVKADLLNAAQRQGIEITPEVTAKIDEMATAYIKASQDAERLKTATERGQDAFLGLFGSILDGADSVKSALANLLMQMAQVQMQNAAMKAMTSMGGGGIMGMVGSLLTPFGGGRATGGPVSGGTSYLVGEKGPEIITMGGNGYVTPNHELGGGGAPVINFHVDARGAVEGMAESIRHEMQKAMPQFITKAVGEVQAASKRGRM